MLVSTQSLSLKITRTDAPDVLAPSAQFNWSMMISTQKLNTISFAGVQGTHLQ